MTTQTPVGYLYRDEYYCPACIVAEVYAEPISGECDDPEGTLNAIARVCSFDRSRPASFSQRDFPHTITSGQLDEPVRCDACMEEIR